MLISLNIENFAIVDKLEVNFSQGLSTITGETGSGKSIVIGALGLVLGERAESGVVRQGQEAARVSALFSVSLDMRDWLLQHDLHNTADSDECVVRRVVRHNGRSRSYINDQPVSLQTLRQFGEYLVDIHGQHAHQSLLKSEIQRQLLDEMAEDQTALQNVVVVYKRWRKIQDELDKLASSVQDRDANLTLLRYQVEELEEFELTEDSIQNLEEEHRRLANAHELQENSQRALALISGDQRHSALSCLTQANQSLSQVEKYDTQLNPIIHLIEEANIQVQEAVSELRHYAEHLHMDPERLDWVDQRIGALQNLARKHKVNFIELPAYFEQLTQQLAELEHYKEKVAKLEKEIAVVLEEFQEVTHILYEQRVANAAPLSEKITAHIHELGMPGGKFVIKVTPQDNAQPSAHGTDKVEFLVSTNPGQDPKPLHKVASGGELSRISLSIQVITAQTSGVPTMIFDEVDVGVGGGIAEIIGQLLRHLGQQRQVLCITHLAQVASQGHHHYQVKKTTRNQNTNTQIKPLTEKQRVEEIARMLGGVKITKQTLAHANEMLQAVQQADNEQLI